MMNEQDEWCTKSVGMCRLSCGEVSGEQYLSGKTTSMIAPYGWFTLNSDQEYKKTLTLTVF
jgi:hypothetical protein